ncbi:prolyl-tRNA synthetase [Saprolegnia parasitica CBS 223.65]|uniref:proline--tRNA ligase n=1 Tax=Saprolegnia parasitica (strain CBS 223.65) TaxID=695850 RepID=A0A067BX80_SAPPC|nr:prolyl-tRNA synthetase [Saprolegnia parasitica CBS 223.65]KDO21460.1 prolyl-tRNA synthetase [Saprolegnia parasitica CBS 223.65]|eukprot:XP_012207805.1 prolyl-tRNA synthetase [Saprolegnia parasitica CBS 223.65]
MWRSVHRLHGLTSARSLSTAPALALRSATFIPTTKEVPADAAIPSHQLLVRAGFIRKTSNGIYMMLPLAGRSLAKLEAIIDTHMHAIKCSKLSMPCLLTADLWQETGRWESSGPELFRVTDRRDVAHCLGPTHEEVFTSLVASTVSSPKLLPLRLYQIGRKYRDEIRPRFGLLRAKEFVMKDAYTFDVDRAGAETTYHLMVDAYHKILATLQLPIAQVEADTGNIGGSLSHEFHVLSGFGEDALLSCSSCTYAANVEKARGVLPASSISAPIASLGDLVASTHGYVPTLYLAENKTQLVVVLTPEGRDVNPLSLKDHIDDVDGLVQVKPGHVECALSLPSPRIFVDAGVAPSGGLAAFLAGQNAVSGHFRLAKEHDGCPCCEHGKLVEKRGIEVGHVFYLGHKYSKALGATYVDTHGKAQNMDMGCYGMGVTRLMAASVESLHDKHGIVWPDAIAPYKAVVIGVGKDTESTATAVATDLAAALPDDVMLDDRWAERPGVKLTEAELIGYTWRIVVGSGSPPRGSSKCCTVPA